MTNILTKRNDKILKQSANSTVSIEEPIAGLSGICHVINSSSVSVETIASKTSHDSDSSESKLEEDSNEREFMLFYPLVKRKIENPVKSKKKT